MRVRAGPAPENPNPNPNPNPDQVGSLGSADDYARSFAGGLAEAIGSRLVTKQVLVAALEAHLKRWQAQAISRMCGGSFVCGV